MEILMGGKGSRRSNRRIPERKDCAAPNPVASSPIPNPQTFRRVANPADTQATF
jgi:hypothetical protein